ncbi:MAG: hypothetical protein JW966_03285 [Anaerolineae bacterium]|nr:hypothetical protein [Anaerolineae bacterium]
MPELNQITLINITAALFALAVLLFLVSLHLFRRSRKDVFWRRRREAGQRGWRFFVLSVGLLFIGGIFCVSSVAWMTFFDEETTAGDDTVIIVGGVADLSSARTNDTIQAPSPTPDVLPTVTPATPDEPPPVEPVIIVITATPAAAPTITPFVTFTPNAAPIQSDVTPQPNAQISVTALDDAVSGNLQPVNPRDTFVEGTTRIYFFVEFEFMTQGVLWRRELYRNGEQIEKSRYLWGLETDGESFFFFGDDNGFTPGSYEIRLFIGDNVAPAAIVPFTITPSE